MFEPVDKQRGHAIREAVFGLQFASAIKPDDLKKFIELGKDKWASDLPAHEEFRLAPFLPVPSQSPIAFNMIAGASFQSFKKDGNLSWRALAQDNVLAINCLDYEGWDKAWPTAREYLVTASEALVGPKNLIAGATLQYINAFHWRGSSNRFDIKSLLRVETDLIPKDFWDRTGNEWHLHQGWYDDAPEPIPGRILHRDHISSVIEDIQNRKTPVVLLDLLCRYDFTVRDSSSENFFTQHADSVFRKMRLLVRRALRHYLRDDMLEQIKAIPLQ